MLRAGFLLNPGAIIMKEAVAALKGFTGPQISIMQSS